MLGIVAAVVSALGYGVASALQAVAAREEPDSGGIDARLLARLVRRLPFVASLGLDLIGFVGQFIALRYLAIYVVQAVQAGSLAVTAVAAMPLLGARVRVREWWGVVAVCVGLIMLASAAGAESVEPASLAVRVWVLVTAIAVAGLGYLIGQFSGRRGAVALGVAAGLGFGVVALAARAMTDLSIGALASNPATYALPIAGLAAFLFYTTGLQRGAVTTVTAAVIIAETVLPGVVGVIVLGDRTRPGLAPLAIIGFVISVGGALVLARFGEVASAPGAAATDDPDAQPRATVSPPPGRPSVDRPDRR